MFTLTLFRASPPHYRREVVDTIEGDDIPKLLSQGEAVQRYARKVLRETVYYEVRPSTDNNKQ